MTDKIFNFLVNYFSNINDRGVDEMNNFRGDITSDEIVEWLKNIQNTSLEQPSEDLENVAKIFMPNEAFHAIIEKEGEGSGESVYDYRQMVEMFVTGANWQKEQDKVIIERAEDHAKLGGIALGEKEAKEKFINKACQWLVDNVNGSLYYDEVDNAFVNTDELVTTFKEGMEKEDEQ